MHPQAPSLWLWCKQMMTLCQEQLLWEAGLLFYSWRTPPFPWHGTGLAVSDCSISHRGRTHGIEAGDLWKADHWGTGSPNFQCFLDKTEMIASATLLIHVRYVFLCYFHPLSPWSQANPSEVPPGLCEGIALTPGIPWLRRHPCTSPAAADSGSGGASPSGSSGGSHWPCTQWW